MIINKAKTFFQAVAVAIFLIAASCVAAQDGENIKIRFGTHFASTGGQSSAQLFDMTQGVIDVFKKNYGIEVVMKTFPSVTEVEEAFLKNEIDTALFWSGQVVEITEKGGGVQPWGTYQYKKSKKSAYCLFQRKNEKALNVSGVFGKRLINTEYVMDTLLFLRDFFYRNGVDKPLWRVFRSFIRSTGANSTFMALSMGDADVFWTYQDSETFLKLLSPNVADKVSYSLCSDSVYAHATIVLNKKTLTKDKLKKLNEALVIFLGDYNRLAKTDTRIKALKQYMNLVQFRLVPAQPDEFDYEINLFKDARKRGWTAEAEFIMKQMEKAPKGKPVEIKPDYDYCQKTCPAGKGQIACIDKCME